MTVRVVDLGDRKRDREATSSGRWHVIQGGAQPPGTGRRNGDEPDPGTLEALRGVSVQVPDDLGGRSRLHEAALRGLNVAVSALGLAVTAPLFLLIAIAIKLDSDGPVFYRQLRVGMDRRRGEDEDDGPGSARRTGNLGGEPFVLYKFRTMEVDAEHESGPSWSDRGDDRVTPVGRFLRRHRLDELPQLWNVLKGEMAVVGPRPERPLFFQRLREVFDAYPRRQTVPPGITGWAQVNRDSDTSLGDVEHKLRYDLEYLERRSLWFDAYVMLKTPTVMLRRDSLNGDGASDEVRLASGKEAQ